MTNDANHLSFQQEHVTFRGDPTTIVIHRGQVSKKLPACDYHLSVDEITQWSLQGEKTNNTGILNAVMSWSARCGEDADKAWFTLSKHNEWPRWLDETYAGLMKYSVSTISPKIALRIVGNVLEGKTVELLGYGAKNGLWISRDGLVREEGTFKKRKEIYPWSDYQGSPGKDEVHWRISKKTIQIKRTGHINHGVAPMALGALAKHFGS